MDEETQRLLILGRALHAQRQAIVKSRGGNVRDASARISFAATVLAGPLATLGHAIMARIGISRRHRGFTFDYHAEVIGAQLRCQPPELQPLFILPNPVAIPALLSRVGIPEPDQEALTWLLTVLLRVSPEQAWMLSYNFPVTVGEEILDQCRQLPFWRVPLTHWPFFERCVTLRLIVPWVYSEACFIWCAVYPAKVADHIARELLKGAMAVERHRVLILGTNRERTAPLIRQIREQGPRLPSRQGLAQLLVNNARHHGLSRGQIGELLLTAELIDQDERNLESARQRGATLWRQLQDVPQLPPDTV